MTEAATLDPRTTEFLNRTLGHFIDGSMAPSISGGTLATIDPATGQALATVAHAAAEDVDRAVLAAHEAFTSGPWATMSASSRSKILSRFAVLIAEHAQELAEIESLDNGKPVKLAGLVDVPLTIDYIDYFSGWPTKILGDVIPVGQPNMFVYTRKEPVGVCGQIIPWNFPLLMAAWAIGAPLAAGCTVVLKPAEHTPLAALRLAELGHEAGLPPGVLNVVLGDGTAGAALVRHPLVKKVHFTGSTPVGREIGAECGRQLKKVTLELGGKSPNLILPDADIDAATKGAFQGIYYNTGQVCNAGSRLYVHKDQYDDVIGHLADRAAKIRLGPGISPDTQMGPVISADQREQVAEYIESGKADGAELVTGGGQPDLGGGYFVEPTLFSVTSDDARISREEIFGPVLVASPYDSIDDLVARANGNEFGLAAGVWTRDVGSAHSLAGRLEAGMVYLNVWGPSDAAAPFGGVKASGLGRIHGTVGLESYLETKTVWTNLG